MPRVARIVVPGMAHHLTQRGNNRQDVFFVDDDRRTYLRLLRERCEASGVRVLAYCLMTNHVHLVVVPESETALAQAIGRTHFTYAQRFNTEHGRSGHLWQGRFYSCAMERGRELGALRYVEQYQITSDQNLNRIDGLWGSAAVAPEWACRVVG